MNNIQTPVERVSFPVTPEIAEGWLANHNYIHQRKIRDYHVSSLSRMMVAGKFRQKTQITFVKLEKSFHLTNGQHTLKAIVKSGITQNLCVIVAPVTSMDEVADDFARHDTHLTRKFSDSLVAHELDVKFGVTRNQLNWITASSVYIQFLRGVPGFRSKRSITHEEKLEIVNRLGDLGRSTLGFFEGHTSKAFLVRKTTFAAAMLCNEKHENAHEFWQEIANDNGLKVGDPRKTLLEWLRSKTTGGGKGGSNLDGKTIVTDHEFMKGIAVCWNAWIEGRELKIIRFDFTAKDVDIKGVGTFTVR